MLAKPLNNPPHLKPPWGHLQFYTNNGSNQWYTLDVDLKKVGFRGAWVGCCGACDGFKSPVPMGAGLQ